jgi:hypothetical protein
MADLGFGAFESINVDILSCLSLAMLPTLLSAAVGWSIWVFRYLPE